MPTARPPATAQVNAQALRTKLLTFIEGALVTKIEGASCPAPRQRRRERPPRALKRLPAPCALARTRTH